MNLVQSFWYGKELSPYEQMCIRSFLYHGHDYDLYTFTGDLNIPSGCQIRDAREFFSEKDVIFYKSGSGKGSVALFANLFRYKLLYKKGGWWVDTDVVCLSEHLPTERYCFGYEAPNVIANAVIKAPINSFLMKKCLRKAISTGEDAVWGQTGPVLFSDIIKKQNLQSYAKPIETFFPHNYVNWGSFSDIFDPIQTEKLLETSANSLMMHLWNELLRNMGIDKYAPAPKGSMIDYLLKKYLYS